MLRFPLLLLALLIVPLAAQDAARLEFFEQRIRPVLVERCYPCHNSSGKRKADLALDDRASLRRGGRSGAAIVVGDGNASLLVRALRHTDPDLRMPAEAPKLADDVIADFVHWIDGGAVDPRDRPPTADELNATLSWDAVRERRQQWWCWQPLRDLPLPDGDPSAHPVDRFVQAELAAAGLQPAPRADRRTLIRRLTFALIGLPPTPAEIDAFVADAAPDAYAVLVDRLLASPHFGERWARHWMDWVRYAESHGSEGDPAIPFAWRYRDYLIRALNADVPYDQLVREHIAGDLLPEPRIDAAAGIDESRIGTAQLRFVQHGFAPTDPLEEQVRFTDNQIDVLSKAFLGLTVSCARCHDHKFDAIGQRDYYALFGVLASCRPATVTVDTPARLATNQAELAACKARIKQRLAQAWRRASERFAVPPAAAVLQDAANNEQNPLHAWSRAHAVEAEAFEDTWAALVDEWQQSRAALARQQAGARGWDLRGADYRRWFAHGSGLPAQPSPAGEFSVLAAGERIVDDLLPAGVYTHALSTRHNGVLGSPRFAFDMQAIYVRVAGGGGARVRYVVRNYPRDGTVYPIQTLQPGDPRWVRWDVAYWSGDQGYLEIGTAADQPVVGNARAERSWFGITQAVFVSAEQVARGDVPRVESAEFTTPLFEAAAAAPPRSAADLDRLYGTALRTCIGAWTDGTMTDAQARFLGFFVRSGLLPRELHELPELTALVAAYRELEAAVPVPTRAPGVFEADAFDQPFLPRGDHRKPGEPVPRAFLAAIDGRPYRCADSGRLQLAADLVRADNPLTPRVAVNRLWHHLFGRGLVATTDNFGRAGEPPSHPQLLDSLARRFVDGGWSIKQMIRLLVTSDAFCRDSRAPAGAAQRDPDNRLLSHFGVRRLEAEAFRDALLAVSGELDAAMYGPGVDGDSPRRSVYVQVRRNDLDPLLRTFDAPEPHTTRGQRDATNVPAQALALLNDPFVRARAAAWAAAAAAGDADTRLARMFEAALGRPPTPTETAQAQRFLDELARRDAELDGATAALDAQIAADRAQLAALTEPIRQRLLAANGDDGAAASDLGPIAAWDFDAGLDDAIGGLHGTAHGNAHLEDGALVLDGASYVATAPLQHDLRAKTLEARVLLDGLEQRGGGVIGVETIGGGVFDTIVFGEKEPRQWLPGSDFFHRSRNPGGAAETGERAVHLAITYADDGTIAVWRDGEPYGEPYRADGPVTFAAGDAVVLFGLRHSPADGNRRLRGRILDARLYDRALTAEEVAASARGERRFVSRAQLLAAMTAAQRAASEQLERQLTERTQQRAQLEEPAGFAAHPERLWRDYALALFTLEEFLYLR